MAMLKQALITICMLLPSLASAQISWNDKAVKWYGFQEGVEIAQRENKPVLLVVYADWCGVCKDYSRMFFDPKVVDSARRVVLIRLNQDTDTKVFAKYGLEGKYVPRTYILNKNLVIQPSPYKSKNYGFFLSPDSNDLLVNILTTMKP